MNVRVLNDAGKGSGVVDGRRQLGRLDHRDMGRGRLGHDQSSRAGRFNIADSPLRIYRRGRRYCSRTAWLLLQAAVLHKPKETLGVGSAPGGGVGATPLGPAVGKGVPLGQPYRDGAHWLRLHGSALKSVQLLLFLMLLKLYQYLILNIDN